MPLPRAPFLAGREGRPKGRAFAANIILEYCLTAACTQQRKGARPRSSAGLSAMRLARRRRFMAHAASSNMPPYRRQSRGLASATHTILTQGHTSLLSIAISAPFSRFYIAGLIARLPTTTSSLRVSFADTRDGRGKFRGLMSRGMPPSLLADVTRRRLYYHRAICRHIAISIIEHVSFTTVPERQAYHINGFLDHLMPCLATELNAR